MHVNQPCVYDFFIPGCGCSRLALSALPSQENKQQHQEGRSRGRAEQKCRMREGGSVPPPPIFLRPCVCFKLLQALQPRLKGAWGAWKGERRGWPGSALWVCVCGKRNDMEFGFPHSVLNPEPPQASAEDACLPWDHRFYCCLYPSKRFSPGSV